MAKIANDVTALIGDTPLVKINKMFPGSQATVLAKLEFYNPASASRTVLLSPSLTQPRLPVSSSREALSWRPRPAIRVSAWL